MPQYNDQLPLNEASTIPSAWYFDSAIAKREQSAFHHSWQLVGRTEQIAEPGYFFTATIAGEPVIVTRDRGGEVRAFSNVCRHKATKVEAQCEGKTAAFRCRYHGWTYDLQGSLRGIPEMEGAKDFCKDQLSLTPFAVATWQAFVFVNLSTNPEPFDTFLEPVANVLAPLQLNKLQFYKRLEYTMDCNWKVFVDNYLDGGYHVNSLHPSLAGVINYKDYRSEVNRNGCIQYSPLQNATANDSDLATVRSVRQGDMAHYVWMFPNLMLNVYEGFMDTNIVLPVSEEKSLVYFDFYYAPETIAKKKDLIDESIKVAHQIQLEDQEICESVQRGLHSFTYDTGRLSPKREIGIQHFHKLLSKIVE
jgi:choline monooxygenase